MLLLRTAAQARAALPAGAALTPTMGGLHDGHLALARAARQHGKASVVSVYVNPTQFAPHEDFADYPRRLRADCEKLRGIADAVYAPSDQEMYPQAQSVGISLPPLATELCGKTRPHFFFGVALVVCKLFNQLRPRAAIFGEKDYQQLHIIREMTRQLALPVCIVAHPTVREADGLAMSSRNAYLTADERRRAPALFAALTAAGRAVLAGATPAQVCAQAKKEIAAAGMECEYVEARDADSMGAPVDPKNAVLLAAARLGRARLIDNIIVSRLQ